MDQLTLPHENTGHAHNQGPWTAHIHKLRYLRIWRWLIAAAVAVPLLAAAAGFGLAYHNITALVDSRIATDDYYLPVNSRQLTVTIVPLVMGPGTRAAWHASGSEREELAAEQLTDSGLTRLTENLDAIYPFGYAIGESLEIPDEFFSSERQQYRADLVLDWLVDEVDPHSFRTAGLLEQDIYQPGFNFLFGLAKLGGQACIASVARMGTPLNGEAAPVDERWHSIVRHELGHTLGLQHNEDWNSVMAYGDSLGQLDQQGEQLTGGDWARLREIHPIKWDR